MNEMLILEARGFSKWVTRNRLRKAVNALIEEMKIAPDVGDVIPKGSGLRKVRMAGQGRGKSGGFRVIYLLCVNREVAVLIHGYSKSVQEDLTPSQLQSLVADIPTVEAIALLAHQQAYGENK